MPFALESDIRIDFPTALSVRKFDDSPICELSYCMSSVDFIVELPEKIFFIEIKDPDDPNAKEKSRQEFIEELTSGDKLRNKLKVKCRDSFLYEYCMERIHKPIHYCVILGLESLSDPDLLTQSDLLAKYIPVSGPVAEPWRKSFIQSSHIFSIRSWNAIFKDFPITRISKNHN